MKTVNSLQIPLFPGHVPYTANAGVCLRRRQRAAQPAAGHRQQRTQSGRRSPVPRPGRARMRPAQPQLQVSQRNQLRPRHSRM
jgi:hypothetical protein